MSQSDSFPLKTQAEQCAQDFAAAVASVRAALSSKSVNDLRVQYLGRKGRLAELMEGLRQVSKEQRPEAGKIVNGLRQSIESSLDTLKTEAIEATIAASLAAPPIDVTLPTTSDDGALHPVTLVRRLILKQFRHLGFTVYDGPEIEGDFYNFAALNFPAHHPARDMQDTFFVKKFEAMLLRTHTSPIQIHAMLTEKPPLRIVAPGRVFRCDSDPTHTPMFHQIEGFVVDKNISMAHLKGAVDSLLKSVFGTETTTRFRPSFFPFTEPSAEIDMRCALCAGKGCRVCKNTGWLEVGGSGMIHPNVFESVGLDSEEWTGFAFGFGLDRLAMIHYGLSDLRELFSGQRQFLSQFPTFA